MHFYSLSPLVWLWFVFSLLILLVFSPKNLILRMLQLGLGHKNNPVSECFLLQIVVLCSNWFPWIPQIIEKRRRDRINHSLSELRRLVPSAFEKQVRRHRLYIVYLKELSGRSKKKRPKNCFNTKTNSFFPLGQGSSKMEKAEILQMTVDHLKLLHAMGGKGERRYWVRHFRRSFMTV